MAVTAEIRWRGNERLRDVLVPIAEPTPHPRNRRRGNLKLIAESLDAFGQQRPIIVQASSGFIVAGNHTRQAAEEILGWTHVAVLTADLADDEADRFLIADNRTSDVAEYDLEGLLGDLRKLEERGGLTGTGYTPDDVEGLLAEMSAALPKQEFKGDFSETPEEIEARRATRAESSIVREVVLMMPEERFVQFGTFVKLLMREWELGGITDTIYRAVEEAAQRAHAAPAVE